MSTWKVILATLVIFITGVFTGVVGTWKFSKTQSRENPGPPAWVFQGPEFVQQRFLERMKTDLKLSPEQSQRMEALFRETRVKMKNWWDIVGPEMQTELREVKEKTRAILNSEQREKFEQLLKDRRRSPGGPGGEKRPHDRRQPGPGGGGSNVSPAGPNPPPSTPGPKPGR